MSIIFDDFTTQISPEELKDYLDYIGFDEVFEELSIIEKER